MMRKTLPPAMAALALALTLTLSGCAATGSPETDGRFGDSLRILQAGQLIAPDAPTRHGQTLPPSDGRTVSEAVQRQVESYRSPPPSNVIQIGVGGSSSGR
jgi:hypothetical protein